MATLPCPWIPWRLLLLFETFLTVLTPIPWEMRLSTICLHMNRSAYVLVISNAFSKMKDFSRSQPVTYTVNVVVSQKRCKAESLLQTLNRSDCGLSNRNSSIQITRNDFQGHSPTASLSKYDFFCTAVQQLTKFQLTQCSAQSLCNSWALCCLVRSSNFYCRSWQKQHTSSQ